MGVRKALIVACHDYQDDKLRKLRSPSKDAAELARVLRDPGIGNFDATIAENESEWQLRRRVSAFFKEATRDDFLLLHFACHGVKDDEGKLYFAATDTEVDNLEATGLSAEFVSKAMHASRSAQVVLLLDCCYSGAFAKGLTPRASDSVSLKEALLPSGSPMGTNRVVITATSATEYAWEGDRLADESAPSQFTDAVVRGLETGNADLNKDGYVSATDLFEYVSRELRSRSARQTPRHWSDVTGVPDKGVAGWCGAGWSDREAQLHLRCRSA